MAGHGVAGHGMAGYGVAGLLTGAAPRPQSPSALPALPIRVVVVVVVVVDHDVGDEGVPEDADEAVEQHHGLQAHEEHQQRPEPGPGRHGVAQEVEACGGGGRGRPRRFASGAASTSMARSRRLGPTRSGPAGMAAFSRQVNH